MIMFFRKLTETWVAKLLLLLIALSMGGLFGLGQMTSYWGAKTDAIRIGDIAVKPQELLRDVEKQARQMTAVSGQYISIQTALALGVLPQVIGNKVSFFLSKIVTEDLGLIASSDAVGNYIVNNPNFQTITGTYDPSIMRAYLTNMQMSDTEFTAALRDELAKKHLTDAISAVIRVPEIEQNAIYTYKNARRDFETILLPASAVAVAEKPTDEVLKTYYEAMEENLYTPEYRQIKVLRLNPQAIADSLPVSDEQIKAVYDERQDIYSTPEKRKVEQILVKDKDTAQSLFDELTADNFKQIASEKAGQDDIDLGWVEKKSVVEEVGEAVFAAEIGKVLPPVESQFGFHLLVVREIEQSKQTPFADVKDEIKATIQATQAYDILIEKSKNLDNALGEGQSLADAAKLVDLKPEDVVWVDISGLKDDGKTSANLPKELTEKIFQMNAGDASPLYDYENGYIVAELEDVKPSALRPFDAVKDVLIAEWKKDEQNKNAEAFAQKVLDEVLSSKDMASVAKKHKLETEPLTDVRREDVKAISAQDVETLFNGKKDEVQLISIGPNDHIIVKITKDTSSDEEDVVEKKLFGSGLADQVADSIYQEILTYYEKGHKVEINQALIDSTFAPYVKSSD